MLIVPASFYRINYAVAFLVGIPLNVLLVWLIVYRSPDEMRQYRRVLLLATVIDIVYLVDMLVVIPVPAKNDGSSTFLALGLFGSLPDPWSTAMAFTWEFLLVFSMNSLAVPFVYRYYVSCREKKWGLREFLLMLLVPLALCIWETGFISYNTYVDGVVESTVADDTKTYTIRIAPVNTVPFAIASLSPVIFAALNYALIVFYGHRLYRYFNTLTEHLTADSAQVWSRQIMTTLIIQAIVPLVMEILPPILIVNLTTASNLDLYALAPVAWIPVVNPLVTMWIVGGYRRVILAWVRRFNYLIEEHTAERAKWNEEKAKLSIKADGNEDVTRHDVSSYSVCYSCKTYHARSDMYACLDDECTIARAVQLLPAR